MNYSDMNGNSLDENKAYCEIKSGEIYKIYLTDSGLIVENANSGQISFKNFDNQIKLFSKNLVAINDLKSSIKILSEIEKRLIDEEDSKTPF